MIIRFSSIVQYIKRLEKKKGLEISKSEKTNLEKKYQKLDRFQNIINHWKSRVDRLLNHYQDEFKSPYD